MPWIIRRTGEGYVTPPGSKKTYVPSPRKARTFDTKEEAEAHCYPDNERPIFVTYLETV